MWSNQVTSIRMGYIFCFGTSVGILIVSLMILVFKEFNSDDFKAMKSSQLLKPFLNLTQRKLRQITGYEVQQSPYLRYNCVPKKHSLARNSLSRGLFYVVNVLCYFKIAQLRKQHNSGFVLCSKCPALFQYFSPQLHYFSSKTQKVA